MSRTTSRAAFAAARSTHTVIPVCREVFADADTPVSIYRKVAAGRPGTFLLESAEQGGVWTRFSFVGAGSFGVLTERDDLAHWVPAAAGGIDQFRLLPGGVAQLEPAAALRAVYEYWRHPQASQSSSDNSGIPELPPLASGFVGYLGWETVRQFERLPDRPAEPSAVPSQALSFVSELVVIDHRLGSVILLANVLNDDRAAELDQLWDDAQHRLDTLQRALSTQHVTPLAQLNREAAPEPQRRTASPDYLAGVERCKQYIVDGDIFQVVLSQRFDQRCDAEPLDVYRVLRHLNPSPYLYLLHHQDAAGKPFAVVGSSPEALITVQESGQVMTHPLAGSRPRGATTPEDQRHERELLADEKERAEHVMLVDLARNDLLRVCEPASVQVTEFMRVERFSHIMHIVSTVEGVLREGQNAVDALRATFPAGTLSGAPKPRALQIIDELETVQRGVYGGVVGYFGLGGAADLAIAIRTATIRDGVAMVQAGGGIVADSVPTLEDQESQHKAAAPLRAVAVANTIRSAPLVPTDVPDGGKG